MPRGGRRHGAGRKPKPKVGADLARVLRHPSVPTTNQTSPIEEFDAPDDLTADERGVWLKQAPYAFKNRTLTRATRATARSRRARPPRHRRAAGRGLPRWSARSRRSARPPPPAAARDTKARATLAAAGRDYDRVTKFAAKFGAKDPKAAVAKFGAGITEEI